HTLRSVKLLPRRETDPTKEANNSNNNTPAGLILRNWRVAPIVSKDEAVLTALPTGHSRVSAKRASRESRLSPVRDHHEFPCLSNQDSRHKAENDLWSGRRLCSPSIRPNRFHRTGGTGDSGGSGETRIRVSPNTHPAPT